MTPAQAMDEFKQILKEKEEMSKISLQNKDNSGNIQNVNNDSSAVRSKTRDQVENETDAKNSQTAIKKPR